MTPKDILTNPSFCPMPWTGLMYNFDGKVKNCIRSEDSMPIGNICNSTIQDIVVGKENLQRQQAITEQQSVPSCQPCYDLERNKKGFDIISDRVFHIRELKKLPLDTYNVGNFDLSSIDVRWTNLCNFACVYCIPRFSSRWCAELNVQPETPTHDQIEKFKEYIFDHAANLKHVYLAGGEPLLMKQNLELLELLLKVNPTVNLRINTNLSKVDTNVFDTVCKFDNVHWTVSVETLDQEYEYVRYGGQWSDFVGNLDLIEKLDHKISFNMLHFLLNYMSVFECVDWLLNRGFHPNSFVIGALQGPDYLNVRHLPESTLDQVRQELVKRIHQNPGYLLEDSYRNMLHYINTPTVKNLQQSFQRIAELDQRRKLDSSKIFKELYTLKETQHGQAI